MEQLHLIKSISNNNTKPSSMDLSSYQNAVYDHSVNESQTTDKDIEFEFREGHTRMSKCRLAIVLTVLSLSMAAMGSSIVMETKSFPLNQWLLIFLYTAAFDILFLMTLIFYYRTSFSEIFHELKQWKQYAFIGMLWSMNYVFILLSAPYLSNTIQVVLAQFQSVLIAFIDWKYIGIILSVKKWLCLALSIALGLASIAFNAEKSESSIPITAFWAICFLVNSFAGGLASLSTEALLKIKREMYHNQLLVSTHATKFEAGKQVVMLNFCTNFYGLFASLLGIPLALYSLHKPPPGETPANAMELIDFSIFTDIRILYWVLMVFSSFFYTIMAGLVAVDQSALFNAMCSSFGACLQLMFFLTPLQVPGHETFNLPSFLLAFGLTIVSAIYVATSDKRDMSKLMESIIGRFYTASIRNERQSFWLPLSGIMVYVVSGAAIAGLWLGNVN